MITSAVGKIFLEAYNEEYGTNYDARGFFIEKFYPLFFDHNKYMMYVTNSPFVQKLPSFRDVISGKKKFENEEQRAKRLSIFLQKVQNCKADASIAIGYPASEVTAPTSGQVTDLQIDVTEEDKLLSWIGGALGITVKGGASILFTKKEILLDIFNGWALYRKSLNDTTLLEGNKINSWNGQWIEHCYDAKVFDENNPFSNFNPYNVDDSGFIGIVPLSWTKILIAISRKYHDVQMLGYVYILSKSNTTVGFIPFNLDGIRKPVQLYRKIFGQENGKKVESLWGNPDGFVRACEAGAIGIKAMEPKGLKDYMNNGKKVKAPKKEEEIISINVYKIWILAMLNNDELWEKSQDLAEMLETASTDENKTASTKPKNLVDNLLNATNKKQFVMAATEVADFVGNREKFKEFVKEVHCMPTDNVPYFLSLLRFQYHTL